MLRTGLYAATRGLAVAYSLTYWRMLWKYIQFNLCLSGYESWRAGSVLPHAVSSTVNESTSQPVLWELPYGIYWVPKIYKFFKLGFLFPNLKTHRLLEKLDFVNFT